MPVEALPRVFAETYQHCARMSDMIEFSRGAIGRAVYSKDPRCIIPQACAPNACRQVCADDIWSTPVYHYRVCQIQGLCDSVVEDCDGLTLLGAPYLGGRALFCNGGTQGHVLTMIGEGAARDLSIEAGMKPYQPRKCLWYDEKGKPRTGTMRGPLRSITGKPSAFTIERD